MTSGLQHRDTAFRQSRGSQGKPLELKTELELALVRRTAAKWSTLLNADGLPAGEVLSVPEVLEHPQVVERGLVKRFTELKLLATTGKERLSIGVDAPTLLELGIDFVSAQWFGMLAPTGTPEAIVNRLNGAMRQPLQDPDVAQRLTE